MLKWVCKHWPRTLSPPFLIRFFSFVGQKVDQFLCLNSSKTTSCFRQPPFYSPFSFILLSHHPPHAENACSGPRTEQTTFTKLIKWISEKPICIQFSLIPFSLVPNSQYCQGPIICQAFFHCCRGYKGGPSLCEHALSTPSTCWPLGHSGVSMTTQVGTLPVLVERPSCLLRNYVFSARGQA